MSEKINQNTKEIKKYAYAWGILIGLGTIIMSLIIAFGSISLNFTLILLFMGLKFVSGFGLILLIISFGMKYLEKNKGKFKGKDNIEEVKKYNNRLMIIPILLLLYKGPIKLFQSIRANGGDVDNYLDEIIFIFAVCNLILKAYLLPLLHYNFLLDDEEEISFMDKIDKKKQKIKKGIKKRYNKLTKNFGKMQYNQQVSIKSIIGQWKKIFAIYSLLILGIGMFIITPVCLIFIIFWVRIIILEEKKLYNFERYLLISCLFLVIFIAIMIPFVPQLIPDSYASIQQYSYLSDLSGFIGLFLGTWMYTTQLRNSEYMNWLIHEEEDYAQKEERKE